MTDDQREKDIDRLIEDIEAEKRSRQTPSQPQPVRAPEDIAEERKAKVSGFRLQLDLDEEYGDVPPAVDAAAPPPVQAASAPPRTS